MFQIKDGEIINYQLPKVGLLSDGRNVSGYHLLDIETLKVEGWLPVEDIKPEYDSTIETIVNDGYEILKDKVIKKYAVIDIPEPDIQLVDRVTLTETKVVTLEETMDVMFGGAI